MLVATVSFTSAGIANADTGIVDSARSDSISPSSDTLIATVEGILKKAPGTVSTDVQLKPASTVITATSNPSFGPNRNASEGTLIASVSATDQRNSIVAESETTQSLLTLLEEGTDTAIFDLTVPQGYVAELAADGGIQLKSASGNIFVPFIAAPWAKDANGKNLATVYELKDTQIVQHVSTQGAKYPIVADPSIQWVGITPYVAMWGFEANVIANTITTFLALAASAGCFVAAAKIGGYIGALIGSICATIGLTNWDQIFTNLRRLATAQTWLNNTCYGFPIFPNKSTPVRIMPSRDCG